MSDDLGILSDSSTFSATTFVKSGNVKIIIQVVRQLHTYTIQMDQEKPIMNKQLNSNRIESIDILRGVVMVIMALDHVRTYFNYGLFYAEPTDIETTTVALFFTRFITHYCAPVFVFLAGTAAFLYGSKKSKPALFKFLFTRGIWLIFLEIVVNDLFWFFDLSYSIISLQVIWAIGCSMVFLSFLIYLPKKVLLILAILLVAGHNALDSITMEGDSPLAILWYIFHQNKKLILSPELLISFKYPIIPWIGIMALGYLFGTFYQKGFKAAVRVKWLTRIGISLVAVFFILRGLNFYGDLTAWSTQDTFVKSVFSFFNVTKYPPSLLFFCITLGPALLFLAAIENTKNKVTDFFLVFGRVPLFYYFLHIPVIHLLAIIGIVLQGGDWQLFILDLENFQSGALMNYGYSLLVVYVLWVGVVFLLYPMCKKYMKYKANNKDKWWLSYL